MCLVVGDIVSQKLCGDRAGDRTKYGWMNTEEEQQTAHHLQEGECQRVIHGAYQRCQQIGEDHRRYGFKYVHTYNADNQEESDDDNRNRNHFKGA